jgi:hypothetical protein
MKRVHFTNGLTKKSFEEDVLQVNGVTAQILEVSIENAEIVIFGPYGEAVPRSNKYKTVAYICENFRFDGPQCDYLFSVSPQKFSDASCHRIQWHGIDPNFLVKDVNADVQKMILEKDRFCAFLYSNRVPYREEIFKRLSKYKVVDSPGKCMSNMRSIDMDRLPGESRWDTKRRFLGRYKFTLALENETFLGYQTEKLYDPMRANSVPIYLGDPNVTEIFDDRSFINLAVGGETPYWITRLEDFSQLRWSEVFGNRSNNLGTRVLKKARRISRDVRHKWLFSKIMDSMMDQIVEADRNEQIYATMLQQPWLKENRVPSKSLSRNIWEEILSSPRQLD